MIIDAHTHILTPDTERYPLADPDLSYRPQTDGAADLLKAEMEQARVDRAFTITAGFYGWDNSYAMDQLPGREDWLAVGVLVDPASSQGPEALEKLVEQGACGLRIQRHLFYHRDLDDPVSTPLWTKAAELGLTVDINATTRSTGRWSTGCENFPRRALFSTTAATCRDRWHPPRTR